MHIAYLWNKHQNKNNCRSNEEPQGKECSIEVDEHLQWVEGDKNDRSHYAGHINSGCYVLGVINTFDFHFADGKWKDECSNL